MLQRVELPIHLVEREDSEDVRVINCRYHHNRLCLIDTKIEETKKITSDSITCVPEGSLLLCLVRDKHIPGMVWERKECKQIIAITNEITMYNDITDEMVVHCANEITLYDVSSEPKIIRSLGDLEQNHVIISVNNKKFITSDGNESKLYDIDTGFIKERIGAFFPLPHGKIGSFKFTEKDYCLMDITHVIEYDDNFEEKRRIVLQERAHGDIIFIRHSNGYFILLGTARVKKLYHVTDCAKFIMSINSAMNVYVPHRILFNDKSILDLTTMKLSHGEVEQISNIFYFPILLTNDFYNVGYTNMLIDDGDKVICKQVETFSNAAFASPSERRELKCIIKVYMSPYISVDICNMLFQCLDTP